MIKIIGSSHKKVVLRDLGDVVYYKQQKVFTDSEYKKSNDLKDHIKSGELVIVEQVTDRPPAYNGSSIDFSPAPQIAPKEKEDPNLKVLVDKIQSLERVLKDTPKEPAPVQNNDNSEVVKFLSSRIKELEDKLSEKSNSDINQDLIDTIKNIEKRLDSKNKENETDDIFGRIETILKNMQVSGPGIRQSVVVPERRVEDVYVPTVSVEDANSHIKLNVRTIEKSDSVQDSLRKLKELKAKQNKS